MGTAGRLSELIRLLREQRGHSSRQFAAICGLSRETLRQYETGVAFPSNQSLMKILIAAGLDPEADEDARQIILALYEERSKKEPSKKRAFGVAANSELLTIIGNKSKPSSDKVNRITSLFFEHCEIKRTDSLEHYLAQQITRILED